MNEAAEPACEGQSQVVIAPSVEKSVVSYRRQAASLVLWQVALPIAANRISTSETAYRFAAQLQS